MSVLSQPALQQQTLRLYGELLAIAPQCAGKLVLGVGEGCSTGGAPAACSLAGAASLLVEPGIANAKATLRDGGIDFLVSTVDEALRTLKNEIRKGRPLAVALVGDVEAAVRELQERGVLPDLLLRVRTPSAAGGSAGVWDDVRGLDPIAASMSPMLARWLRDRGFEPRTWCFPARAAAQVFDERLLRMLPTADTVRRDWLWGITRYQRSAGLSAGQVYRTAWITAEERERFRDVPAAQTL